MLPKAVHKHTIREQHNVHRAESENNYKLSLYALLDFSERSKMGSLAYEMRISR